MVWRRERNGFVGFERERKRGKRNFGLGAAMGVGKEHTQREGEF